MVESLTGAGAKKGKSLVLVVGAGASSEVGLPIGEKLKGAIARKFDFRTDAYGKLTGGDEDVAIAMRILAANETQQVGSIEDLIQVAKRIRDAMPLTLSIDNYVHNHRNSIGVSACAKIAIARCILESEKGSRLRFNRTNIYDQFDFNGVRESWFNSFFHRLTENCEKSELPGRLGNVAIVSFNYDRCIEHYLFLALQTLYGVSEEESARLVRSLEIYHPYGKVGDLPKFSSSQTIPFGADLNGQQLLEVSMQLRTFTEGTDPDSSEIDVIRRIVAGAERILFLGFAFHDLNLSLLFPEPVKVRSRWRRSVFGTALGLSENSRKEVIWRLAGFVGCAEDEVFIRSDLPCSEIFSEYPHRLSF